MKIDIPIELQKVTTFKMIHSIFLVGLLVSFYLEQVLLSLYLLAIIVILLQYVQFKVIDQLNSERSLLGKQQDGLLK